MVWVERGILGGETPLLLHFMEEMQVSVQTAARELARAIRQSGQADDCEQRLASLEHLQKSNSAAWHPHTPEYMATMADCAERYLSEFEVEVLPA